MLSMIFDTETTRFPQWKLPNDHPDQVQLMQLGIIIVKGPDVILEWDKLVVCSQEPEPGAFGAHGISREMCHEAGVSLNHAVGFFLGRLREVDRIVCHNVAFDTKVMCCAIAQANLLEVEDRFSVDEFLSKPNVCTMLSATDIVKAVGKIPGKWKWPTLQESYRALVDPEGFEGAHSALVDCQAAHKVLVALEDRGVELRSASR